MGLILLAAIVISMVMLYAAAESQRTNRKSNVIAAGIIATVAVTAVLIVFGGIIALESIGRVNDIEAYAQGGASIYSAAVEDMRAGVPRAGEIGLLDAANLQQIDAFSRAVAKDRDMAIRFNNQVRRNRFWEHSFFVGIFVRDLDPSIAPIGSRGY